MIEEGRPPEAGETPEAALPEGERRPTGIRGPFSNGPHRAGDRMQLRLNGTPIMVEVHSVP